MGKKGKKATKQQQQAAADGGAEKKVGPGKARRERAAKIRDLEARLEALAEKLDVELKDVPVFSPIQEEDECPICFVTLPLAEDERDFMPCCAQWVCNACSYLQGIHEVDDLFTVEEKHNAIDDLPCALCRSSRLQDPASKLKALAENKGNTQAMFSLGWTYMDGMYGVPKDELLALDWFVRASEKGFPKALVVVANLWFKGNGVKKNVNFAKQLAMAAAKRGCADAHDLLGFFYWKEFEADPLRETTAKRTKFLDHWKFAAAAGWRDSMEKIEKCIEPGIITQEEADGIREEFEKATKLEWTEEREEFRKDCFRGRRRRMVEEKLQRAQAI